MEFSTTLQHRSPISWKLYNLGIWQGGSELDIEIMRLVTRYIPFIRSFWDNGNTEDEEMVFDGYRTGTNLDYVKRIGV